MQQFYLPAVNTKNAGNRFIPDIKTFSNSGIKLLYHRNSIFQNIIFLSYHICGKMKRENLTEATV